MTAGVTRIWTVPAVGPVGVHVRGATVGVLTG